MAFKGQVAHRPELASLRKPYKTRNRSSISLWNSLRVLGILCAPITTKVPTVKVRLVLGLLIPHSASHRAASWYGRNHLTILAAHLPGCPAGAAIYTQRGIAQQHYFLHLHSNLQLTTSTKYSTLHSLGTSLISSVTAQLQANSLWKCCWIIIICWSLCPAETWLRYQGHVC